MRAHYEFIRSFVRILYYEFHFLIIPLIRRTGVIAAAHHHGVVRPIGLLTVVNVFIPIVVKLPSAILLFAK